MGLWPFGATKKNRNNASEAVTKPERTEKMVARPVGNTSSAIKKNEETLGATPNFEKDTSARRDQMQTTKAQGAELHGSDGTPAPSPQATHRRGC